MIIRRLIAIVLDTMMLLCFAYSACSYALKPQTQTLILGLLILFVILVTLDQLRNPKRYVSWQIRTALSNLRFICNKGLDVFYPGEGWKFLVREVTTINNAIADHYVDSEIDRMPVEVEVPTSTPAAPADIFDEDDEKSS